MTLGQFDTLAFLGLWAGFVVAVEVRHRRRRRR